MKKIILFTIFSLMLYGANAQRFHLNMFGGIANYGGDLQAKGFTFKQSKPAFALGMSYEISDKFYVRSEYSVTRIGANDNLSNNLFQLHRNLNFKTVVQELNLMAEYDVLNVYSHRLVPYVFAGVGVFRFSPYTYDSLGTKIFLAGLHTEGQGLPQYPDRKPYSKTQINIPAGIGVKFALSDNIRVGAELGFRKLFTDYFDDVSTRYPDLNLLSQPSAALSFRGDELKPPVAFLGAGSQRGNAGAKDDYYFLMFRISYRLPFGNNNNGDDAHSGRYHRNCPPIRL